MIALKYAHSEHISVVRRSPRHGNSAVGKTPLQSPFVLKAVTVPLTRGSCHYPKERR